MLVGTQLPIQAQSVLVAGPWEAAATVDDLARVAQTCDRAGFGYVAVCDHVAIPQDLAPRMGTFWMDPVSTLGWLAAHTTRTRLLTHVYVLPYRHPRMAAKQFATIDHLSGGRLIAGIGVGHVEAEFDMLGIDFAGRGPGQDTALSALIQALEHEFVAGLGASPRPVQVPRPPLWIAGSSPAAVRRAAQFGDGWLPQGPATAELVDELRRQLDRFERDPAGFTVGHIARPVYVGAPTWDVGTWTVSGSVERVAERLIDGLDPAVNQIQIKVMSRSAHEHCAQIEAAGAELLPLLGSVR